MSWTGAAHVIAGLAHRVREGFGGDGCRAGDAGLVPQKVNRDGLDAGHSLEGPLHVNLAGGAGHAPDA